MQQQLSGDWHLLRATEVRRGGTETSVRRSLVFQ